MTTTDRARTYLAAVPGAAEGDRDHATIATACKLVERFDLPEEELQRLLLGWNEQSNTPPLPEREVAKCLRSARARTAYDPALADGHATSAPARARRPQAARPAPARTPEPPAAPLPTEVELGKARALLIEHESEPADRARAYLRACGVDPAACGWGLARLTAPQAHEHGLPASAAGVRLLVPIYLPDGTLADVRRYRGPFGAGADRDKLLPWAAGHGAAKPYRFERLAPDADPVVWCEGEKDAEALAAAGCAAVSNTCGALSAMKVAHELAADLVAGRRFVLLFDHDKAGRDGARRLAEALARRGARVALAAWPETLPDGKPTPAGFDAADWFRAGFDREGICIMLDNADPFELPAEEAHGDDEADAHADGPPPFATCLRDFGPYVDRALSKRASRAVKQRVSRELVEWAVSADRLVWDPAVDRGYLVDDGRAVPLADERDVGLWVALRAAGVNPTETAFRWLLADLTCAAAEKGEKLRLARWSACDRDTGAVYVTCGDRHVVRAMPDADTGAVKVEVVPNGTDNVLFARDACLPTWRPAAMLDPLTLAPFRCPLDAAEEYTVATQHALLRVWLIATVANLRPLPLLAPLGSKGSGKTTLARSVARLFLGPDADVVPMSDDARDFDTSVTTKPLHALDNVDASETPPWFADRLATVVTGGAVERRALFTNAGVYRAPVTAALVVTSRTAAYARPDVVERTLPLLTVEFERDEERKADADLAGMVEAARDACLTWLAVNAAELLRHLRHAPKGLPLRWVDFARLVWADARADGQEEEARPRLLALRQAQATLVGEGNPLLEAILAMPADEEAGRPWLHGTATDIVRELQNATTVEMPHYGGGKALARHLRELAGILRTFGWRFEERPQSGGHTLFNLQGPATRRPER